MEDYPENTFGIRGQVFLERSLTSHLATKMIPFSQKWVGEQVKRGVISGKIIGNSFFVNRGAVEEYRQLVFKYRK
ncbi:MAG: hypothetical protein AAGB97_04770 [Dehalococcoidia bacterium]|nr:hypothetical protein [Chloroflexota bacterium]MBT9162860.1 hypothetical protein [Chloroflexota bacterium]